MRKILKPIVVGILAALSRGIVRKYAPQVIMVTGSVGKTSTKDAVAAALADSFYLRKSQKSYNSEFGVPLTIIGMQSAWSNPVGWLKIIGEALALRYLPNHYPKLLVLEVGAEQPGELERVLKIVTPDAVVVTLLPEIPVHVEAYATAAEVREEEFVPAMALPAGAPLIINADDRYAHELATKTAARVYTFGLNEDADVRIIDSAVWMEDGKPKGMQATLAIEAKDYEVRVEGAFGQSQLFAPAAAVATALALGIDPADALKGLHTYAAPPGRGRLFAGIKNTLIIDDSYNASPVAVAAALRSLCLLPGDSRKVAVLGDMLELGRYSAEEHARIGQLAASCVTVLITVGTRAKTIGEAAIAAGMSEGDVYHFANSIDGAAAITDLLDESDTVLLKGSQTGVRLERMVKVLLADRADAAKLARQDAQWQRR